MSIKSAAHSEALKDLVEVLSIVTVITIATDAAWCIRDLIVSGPSVALIIIATILTVSAVCALAATIKYHNKAVKTILCRMLHDKLKICKHKAKSKRGAQ